MLLKNVFAVLATGSIFLSAHSAPLKQTSLSKHDYHHPTFLNQQDLPPADSPPLTGGHNTYRMLMFGDSLSDIGNVQLLLKVMNRESSAELLFKPVNESQRFLKLLSYLHLPLEKAELIEDSVADIALDTLDQVVTIPIYPDKKYYYGPEGHKTYGRFSNGPVWSEWFGKMLLGDDISNEARYINRAYGGSWASERKDLKIDWTLDLPELANSIVEYINGKLVPPNMHYLVSGFLDEYPTSSGGEIIGVLYGANDYLNNDYSKPESKANFRAHPTTLVKDIEEEITRLANWASVTTEGAPMSFVYISNLPDISKTPRYNTKGGKKDQGTELLSDIKQHNQLLQQMVSRFQSNAKYQGKVEFRYIDLFNMFNNTYETLPVKNKTEACYPYNMLGASMLNLNPESITNSPPVEPCKNPEDYFFWDVVHPTQQVYASLAQSICKVVARDIASINCFTPDWKDEKQYPIPAFNP